MQGAALTTMAVSLAACGTESTPTPEPTPIPEPIPEPTPAVFQGLQATVTELAAEANAINVALGSEARSVLLDPTVLKAAGIAASAVPGAVTTDAQINTALGQLDNAFSTIGANLDFMLFGNPVGNVTNGHDLADLLLILSPTSAAERIAAADSLAAIANGISITTVAAEGNVSFAVASLGLSPLPTNAEKAVLAAVDQLANALAANALSANLNATNQTAANAAGAAKDLAGIQFVADKVQAIMLANDPVYRAAFNDLSAGNKLIVTDAIFAEVQTSGIVQDYFTGAPTDLGQSLTALIADVAIAINTANSALTPLNTVVDLDALDFNLDPVGDVYFEAVAQLAYLKGSIAVWESFVDSVQAIADIFLQGEAAQTKVVLLEIENDVTIEVLDGTGGTGTGTASDDFFVYLPALNLTTSITDFGADGVDHLVIFGEYTFVTITSAQNSGINNLRLGDETKLEIFVFQSAAGDVTLHIEKAAFDGSVIGDGGMATITLNDVVFADLVQLVGDGFTMLSSDTAAIA
jgi:hypothetical protein